ncbi:hypothetical protein [Natronoglycomyces albus]|uniref:Acyl-CoA oxidase C-alpha1 domain-containing protein n=1 Tax=Natronoglycomyces albus TaxID=2811108 RepID=A0A895XMZ6_9ACTN|nr:hypothetical protein [Natronoglycomyces albus]QSB06497.1 hypothetical protein JQS30_06230 [Natronoglycomyces albus]
MEPNEHTSLYNELQEFVRRTPPLRTLLADPHQTAIHLADAAVENPRLFHRLLLHYCLCGYAAGTFNTEQGPRSDAIALLESGDRAGIAMMTEVGVSSSHSAIATEAHYRPQTHDFLLRTPQPEAGKFPTAAAATGVGTIAAVFARLIVDDRDCGVFTFILDFSYPDRVPAGMDIRSRELRQGLDTSLAIVQFNDTVLPFNTWLSDGARMESDGTFHDRLDPPDRLRRTMSLGTHVWLAITRAAAIVAQSAANLALNYSLQRALPRDRGTVFERPSHQLPLIDCIATATFLGHVRPTPTATTSTQRAQDTTPWADVNADAALCKALATVHSDRVVRRLRERCGAVAYASDGLFLDYLALTHGYFSAGGDNQLILLDVGTRLAMADLADPTAPSASLDSLADLANIAFRCELRLRSNLAGGGATSSDRIAIQTADVYANRLQMEQVSSLVDPDSLEGRLCYVHGLSWLLREAHILITAGALTSKDLATAQQRHERECAAIAKDIRALREHCEQWPIPDHPMGKDDYIAQL